MAFGETTAVEWNVTRSGRIVGRMPEVRVHRHLQRHPRRARPASANKLNNESEVKGSVMPPNPDATPDANLHLDHHVFDRLFFLRLRLSSRFAKICASGGVLWVSLLQFPNTRRATHAIQLGITVMTILFTLYERYGGSSLGVMS